VREIGWKMKYLEHSHLAPYGVGAIGCFTDGGSWGLFLSVSLGVPLTGGVQMHANPVVVMLQHFCDIGCT